MAGGDPAVDPYATPQLPSMSAGWCSRFASRSAISVAYAAMSETRPIVRVFCRSQPAGILNSALAQRSEANPSHDDHSGAVETPEVPSRSFFRTAVQSEPRGQMPPMPVTTTRLGAVFLGAL